MPALLRCRLPPTRLSLNIFSITFFRCTRSFAVSLLLYKRRVRLNIFWKNVFYTDENARIQKTLERPKLTRVITKKKRSDLFAVRLQTTLVQNVMTVFLFQINFCQNRPPSRYRRTTTIVTVNRSAVDTGYRFGRLFWPRKNDAAARNVFRGRKSIRFPSVEQCAKTRSAEANIPRRQYREITIFAVHDAHVCVCVCR